jgi:hypothetical protein
MKFVYSISYCFLLLACSNRGKSLTSIPVSSDSLKLSTTRYIQVYPEFADSSNSYCKKKGDTLFLNLSTGMMEGSYFLTAYLVNNKLDAKFELFGNHPKYTYTTQFAQIIVNKRPAVNDYVLFDLDFKGLGKTEFRNHTDYDTVKFSGKIRLKVRDSSFSYNDLSVENNRNEFYQLLDQKPDTIKKLSLYGCAFTNLPIELAEFINLEELDLDGNDLSKSNFTVLSSLKTLKSLTLNECNLSIFPQSILVLTKLEILSVYNNHISYIPEDLYKLNSLRQLTLGFNNLSYLSPKISQLQNLELLETSATNILVYPEEMVQLKKLVELYPSDTMIYVPRPLVKYVWGCDTILKKSRP